MKKRTVLTLVLLSLAIVVLLVGGTRAWFITLNETPLGQINSALVHYLPEKGERSVPSLVTYGSLISGSSIDQDGTPLTLPGDRLLSGVSAANDSSGNRSIRTSVARAYRAGETPGTLINGEIRYGPDGKYLVRTQRELMDAPEPTTVWYKADGTVLTPPPTIDPGLYDAVTLSNTVVTTPTGQTVTTTTVTTEYKPLVAPTPYYKSVRTAIVTITHEAAVEPVGWAACSPLPRLEYVETVLAVSENADPAKRVTRSRLQIIDRKTEGAVAFPKEEKPLPLVLENRSNVATNVRMGVSVILTPKSGNAETLTMQAKDGKVYFGKKDKSGNFIELLELTPGAETGKYSWDPVAETDPAAIGDAWHLWDLNLTTGGKMIPPIPSPAPSPAPSLPPPSPLPTAAPSPAPVYYRAVREFAIATTPHFLTGTGQNKTFELSFNDLYCAGGPTIKVIVRYYAKQAAYMDWTEFYSQSVSMAVYPK